MKTIILHDTSGNAFTATVYMERGPLAVTKGESSPTYVVTHLPTGGRIAQSHRLDAARDALRALEKVPLDWTIRTADALLVAAAPHRPAINAIREEARRR